MFSHCMEINKFTSGSKVLEKWAAKQNKAILVGGILGFSLTAAYLMFRKQKNLSKFSEPLEPSFNMERYVFDIHTDDGIKQAVVESSGECYAVTLDGRDVGTMWRDENIGLQWNTLDEELTPHLWDISAKLAEAFSRQGFPSILQGAYPEITKTEWKSSETLEVAVSTETDLEVFTAFLKDEVLNLVDFEEHLDLIVKKEDDAYFTIVGIN